MVTFLSVNDPHAAPPQTSAYVSVGKLLYLAIEEVAFKNF